MTRREWAQVQTIRQSKYFRPAWYLRHNHDVARKGVDPALHFIRNGYREGRDPGPRFSVERYLKAHPRVAKAGENALIHAIENGTTRDGVDGSAS